jgi:polyribonucleotide nucleotidyltransferase
MRDALQKAHAARMKILDIMDKTLSKSRKDLSPYAPRILSITIQKDKIREVIGSGGKVIRDIQERTGTTINIEDDGTVQIASTNSKQAEAALKIIQGIVEEPELGKVYEGKVKTIVEFGAFVEFLPGRDGLVHISELDLHRVNRVEDVVKEGDVLKVKLIGFDRNGKVKLSRKALL